MSTASPATQPAGPPSGDRHSLPGYEILEELAPGGMGVVYRARQTALNRIVALKMIRAGTHAQPQELARFRVEAEAVASLSHPHVVQIHDFGEWNGMPYIAMELAEGGSLAERLHNGLPTPAQAAELIETLARVVQFVHERGVIHRDLKPANILFTQQGVAKLADFGLAKRLNQDQGLTRSHAVLGTASYMAPEQATGDKQALGPAADVYGLGAILYELLTGQPPFQAETVELTIHQVLSDDPPPPSQLNPETPAEMEAICLKCLEKEPGRRFASALALAEDLRRYQIGEPISIQSAGAFDRHTRLAQRAGYDIMEVLHAGPRGVIYKALHLPLNRTVALKIISARGRLHPERLVQLRAEAEQVAQLHHPNIVEVYDFGAHNGEPYIATEYVEGVSLAAGSASPPKPVEQTAGLVESLARAVHHAHLQGIVHGGLTLAKVLVGAEGVCKITGFGLAKVLPEKPVITGQDERASEYLSGYIAPEQMNNEADALGPAADLYALGALLHELLTGKPPAPTPADGETSGRARFEPPRHWRPEVPRDLESICLKCLEEKPTDRYPSAAALAEDLRRFRTGKSSLSTTWTIGLSSNAGPSVPVMKSSRCSAGMDTDLPTGRVKPCSTGSWF